MFVVTCVRWATLSEICRYILNIAFVSVYVEENPGSNKTNRPTTPMINSSEWKAFPYNRCVYYHKRLHSHTVSQLTDVLFKGGSLWVRLSYDFVCIYLGMYGDRLYYLLQFLLIIPIARHRVGDTFTRSDTTLYVYVETCASTTKHYTALHMTSKIIYMYVHMACVSYCIHTIDR